MLSVIVTKQITSVSVFHASFQLFTNYEFCHDIVKVAVDVKLSAFSGWVDIAEIINSCLSAKWQISQWVHQHFCSYCPVIDNEFHHWKLRLRIPYPQLFWQCYVTHEKLIRVRNSHQAEETDKEAEGFRNSYRWWWIFRHSRRTTSISWRSRGKIFTVGLWSPYKVDHFVLFIVPSAKNFGHFVWACLLTKISTASFGSRRR